MMVLTLREKTLHRLIISDFCLAAEIKKQRDFYQKLGMEVPGDIKGELCNMKTHLDQRNGTISTTRCSHHTPRQYSVNRFL